MTMVKIHKCKDCGKDIYFKPVFDSNHVKGIYDGGYNNGYSMSFQAMDLNKEVHKCDNRFRDSQRIADYEAEQERRASENTKLFEEDRERMQEYADNSEYWNERLKTD